MDLALNPLDALLNGGRSTFALEPVKPQSGHTALDPGCPPGRYVRISASDSASGIPPEQLPRTFEPYFSTKPAGQGAGPGLASVYGSVRQDQGTIRVDSKPGQGSTFHVFLPNDDKEDRDSSDRKGSGRPGSALDGRHVLVVEDVDVVRRTVVAGLQRAGARVTAVNDGCHALEFLAGGAPIEIVLTDLIMPRMGGLELALELGRLYPTLPIVFMSGYADHEVVEAIVRDRPDQPLLRKPFSVKELTDALSSVLLRSKGNSG